MQHNFGGKIQMAIAKQASKQGRDRPTPDFPILGNTFCIGSIFKSAQELCDMKKYFWPTLHCLQPPSKIDFRYESKFKSQIGGRDIQKYTKNG